MDGILKHNIKLFEILKGNTYFVTITIRFFEAYFKQIYKADIVKHLMETEDINLKVVLSRRKFHRNKTEAIYTDNTGPVVAFEKLGKFPIVC